MFISDQILRTDSSSGLICKGHDSFGKHFDAASKSSKSDGKLK